jgi:hypothetical protein
MGHVHPFSIDQRRKTIEKSPFFSSQSQVMERLKRLLHHVTGDTSGQETGPAEPNEATRSSTMRGIGTVPYGDGSKPINTIFWGMNIHKSQLF